MKVRPIVYAIVVITVVLVGSMNIRESLVYDGDGNVYPAQAQTTTPGPPPTTWWTLGGNPYRTASVTVGTMARTTTSWTFDPDDADFPFHANPVAADFNGDGVIDVALVDSAGALYVVRLENGVLQLRVDPPSLGLGGFSTPTAYDVDSDGRAELIALTSSGKSGFKHVVCLKFNGTWGWRVVWRSVVPFTEVSPPTSPLVWRLDPSGPHAVVVSASDGLYAFNAANGSTLWVHRSYGKSFASSPALLDDVNGDGVLDVVYTRGYPSVVYVVSGRDGTTIREWRLWDLDSRLSGLLLVHSPAVGRATGHACRDIVVSVGRETFTATTGGLWYKTGSIGYLVVLNPCTGRYYVVAPPAGRSFFAWFSQPAIAIANVDGDAPDEIFIVGEDLYLHRVDYTPATDSFTVTWTASPPSDINPNTGGGDCVARAASLAIAEFNGDGLLDVLVIYQTGSATSLSYTLRALRTDNRAVLWTATAITETGTGLKYTFPSISVVAIGTTLRAIVTAFDRVVFYG